MAKKPKANQDRKTARPKRAKLSAQESLQRLQDFTQRKEQFVAAVRKGTDRGVSA
jgi:hypothetical protein